MALQNRHLWLGRDRLLLRRLALFSLEIEITQASANCQATVDPGNGALARLLSDLQASTARKQLEGEMMDGAVDGLCAHDRV